jgi:hypothetical protein
MECVLYTCYSSSPVIYSSCIELIPIEFAAIGKTVILYRNMASTKSDYAFKKSLEDHISFSVPITLLYNQIMGNHYQLEGNYYVRAQPLKEYLVKYDDMLFIYDIEAKFVHLNKSTILRLQLKDRVEDICIDESSETIIGRETYKYLDEYQISRKHFSVTVLDKNTLLVCDLSSLYGIYILQKNPYAEDLTIRIQKNSYLSFSTKQISIESSPLKGCSTIPAKPTSNTPKIFKTINIKSAQKSSPKLDIRKEDIMPPDTKLPIPKINPLLPDFGQISTISTAKGNPLLPDINHILQSLNNKASGK